MALRELGDTQNHVGQRVVVTFRFAANAFEELVHPHLADHLGGVAVP